MDHSESLLAIAPALIKAQSAIEKAEKNSENPHLHSKYANLGSVMEAAITALNTNNIAVLQLPQPGDQGVLLLETVLLHTSGEWVSSMIAMPIAKLDPQSYGAALTYGRRYGLSAAIGVVQEDDDGHSASQTPRPVAPSSPATPSKATGGGNTIRDLFKAMEEADLLEPDPTDDKPDRKKPIGAFYGICDKVGLPKAWSKYTPEQYAAAIVAIRDHVNRHAETPELPTMDDPFADS